MELEELIKFVTDEVTRRLKDNIKSYKKRKILVLEQSNSEEFLVLTENYNKELYECFSLDLYEKNTECYDFILVPKLNNRELANISLGISCGIREEIVIDSILRGKKVYIFEEGLEYRKYNKTCNKVFFKMYEDYEKKLIEFGLSIVGKNKFNTLSEEEEENKEVKKEENENTDIKTNDINTCNQQCILEGDKKLLTETDIDKLYKSGIREIIIKNKTVITPLAKDYIRIKKIIVKRI
ncbi:ethanolamine utilization protein [Clostridium tetanomorphum]|uniref:Ethanolamine utilization protein n=1 Tax=Clostridium tetanomorphum TaxID=1553 RepID=A0A923IYZ2_CLOTT|nr:hypothetical protein [Clostridium tetanomorphum]KAJ52580.1 ethanolamine utilization protein [Clostridium tetanomorphum DSM 665]MBC2396866.1 hypothetical protein [Clostridium tetanomorphum]MBP1863172.1 ethanolamine utilization protein [Clostridium tetanomorphum]NRS84280.1 ethanolamine utilization protein [Clostridium tetanomorphum]NRZ97494.1 ethanolamine utilization protein [Clostridium tetanomorphum]